MPGTAPNDKQNTLTAVIKALRDYIISNKMQPGDRLPTEHELAARFNAGRNMTREAMRYFRTLGIIKSSQRLGAGIGRLLPADPFSGYLPFLAVDPHGLKEAEQMRIALETGAASLMTANRTDDDIAFLQALSAQFAPGKDWREAEIMFHTRLLKLTRNRLIESLIPVSVCSFGGHLGPNFLSEDGATCLLRKHQEIVAALQIRDEHRLINALQ